MEIRRATNDDVIDIARLCRLYFDASPHRDFLTYDEDRVGALVQVALERGAVFLALTEGEIVGVIGLAISPHPLTGQPYAEDLLWFVHPAHRQGRVGPSLLHAAEQCAQMQGAAMLKITSPTGSTLGRFLEHRGYRSVETSYVVFFTEGQE